ncbi:MAG: hypothetical protein U0804_10680 [Gemmataceae bacterium]
MRVAALLLTVALVAAAPVDEPPQPVPRRLRQGRRRPHRQTRHSTARSRPRPAAADLKTAPKVRRAADHRVGVLVVDAPFTDRAGKTGKLSDFRDKAYLVVAMTDPGCPLCQSSRQFSRGWRRSTPRGTSPSCS